MVQTHTVPMQPQSCLRFLKQQSSSKSFIEINSSLEGKMLICKCLFVFSEEQANKDMLENV